MVNESSGSGVPELSDVYGPFTSRLYCDLLAVKPFANVIGDHTCRNREQKINYVINDYHLLPAGRYHSENIVTYMISSAKTSDS